ncbi:MAG: hypothetical protein EPO68_06500 [Planctomycetota bacterium]|nr:MAG: hypothetical protein EPO68_06500 [Planctomycetota bacterium]
MSPRNWETEQPDSPWRLRFGRGHALIAFGLALIVAATLYVATAGYGDRVRELPERRSYNQVKQSLHSAWPAGMCLCVSGVFFCVWGGRVLKRAKSA